MEVSPGWQLCARCSPLICARFYMAAPWLRLAWCRNCNYCCLAEMPSITNKLWCIQIKKAAFYSGCALWIPHSLFGFVFFFSLFVCFFPYEPDHGGRPGHGGRVEDGRIDLTLVTAAEKGAVEQQNNWLQTDGEECLEPAEVRNQDSSSSFEITLSANLHHKAVKRRGDETETLQCCRKLHPAWNTNHLKSVMFHFFSDDILKPRESESNAFLTEYHCYAFVLMLPLGLLSL